MSNNKVKKNFIYNVGYQILLVITPLITSPYVSRVLGVDNIGIYNYTYSIADYFLLFAMLGVKNYGNRQIAMVRDDKKEVSETFWNIYAFQLCTSILSILGYYAYASLFNVDNKGIVFIQGLYILTAAVDISWFYFGMEEFKITVIRNALIKLLGIVSIFIFVRERDDLWIYTLILSGSMLIGFLSVFPFLKKYVYFVKPRLCQMKKHIKPNLVLFIPVIAVSLFNVMDKIMLGQLSSYTQVGLYGNTEKLMRIPLGIITALGTVMMPHMSHMIATGNKEKSKKVIEHSMIFIMFCACALAGGLAGVGKVFAPIFFGEEFAKCGELLIFISPTVLFISWANVIRMQYLIPNKMDTEFTISTILGAVVNLTVNYLLIPKYGAVGAVIGTVCAEGSLTIYQTYVVRKHLAIRRFLSETIWFFIFAAGMFAGVYTIGEHMGGGILTLAVQVGAGAIMYIVCVIVYVSHSKKECIRDIYENINIKGILKKIHR